MWQGNLKADEPYLLISKSANSEKTHLRFLDGRPGWPTSAQAQERIPKGTEDRAVVQAGEYDKAIEVLFWVSSTISSDFSNPLPLIRFCFNVVRKSLSFVYCMCPAWIRNRDIASALAHGFGSMLGTEMGLTRRALGGGVRDGGVECRCDWVSPPLRDGVPFIFSKAPLPPSQIFLRWTRFGR